MRTGEIVDNKMDAETEKAQAAFGAASGSANPGLQMKYFVLKPKGDDLYACASRRAMRQYALTIRRANPQFAHDLLAWADAEWMATDNGKRLAAIGEPLDADVDDSPNGAGEQPPPTTKKETNAK